MAVLLSFLICTLLVTTSLFTVNGQQIPLAKDNDLDLIYELKKAEIIPTVLDEFTPLLTVSVNWDKASADYGNTLQVSRTKHEPKIEFLDQKPGSLWKRPLQQLTIAMSDPDAPSRDDPEWSEICHWIATDVQLTDPEEEGSKKRTLDVMPYKPPGPPPKTGKHRYVFVALAPKNGTTESLNLRKPDDRQHWGYKHERDGLRMWAEEMGLEVVGANFIYEQNSEQ